MRKKPSKVQRASPEDDSGNDLIASPYRDIPRCPLGFSTARPEAPAAIHSSRQALVFRILSNFLDAEDN